MLSMTLMLLISMVLTPAFSERLTITVPGTPPVKHHAPVAGDAKVCAAAQLTETLKFFAIIE